MFCLKDVLKNFAKVTGKYLCQSLFLYNVAGFRPHNFAEFLRYIFYRTPLVAPSYSKIIYFPIPRVFYGLITKQVNNQMFFRTGRNFHIFKTQLVVLIMLPFLNDKSECLTGNNRKLRFPDSCKLFLRRKTSIEAGNILSFLGSSVLLRTLSNI